MDKLIIKVIVLIFITIGIVWFATYLMSQPSDFYCAIGIIILIIYIAVIYLIIKSKKQ